MTCILNVHFLAASWVHFTLMGERMITATCLDCGYDFPFHETYCSHCARPQRFPNVEAARLQSELDALEFRYEQSRLSAATRGCSDVVDRFEQEVQKSRPVICCTLEKIEPLSSNHHDLFQTYHHLQALRSRASSPVSGDPDWDTVRPMVETAVFGEQNKRQIHYASLSLTDTGSPYYGECAILLKESMIAHRTSVYEKNSIAFFFENLEQLRQIPPIPYGHRSIWDHRAKLAVAKLADRLNANTKAVDFQEILLKPSQKWTDDQFIELHVFGPLTLRSFAKVTMTNCNVSDRGAQLRRKVLEERLTRAGIDYAEVP